MKKNKLTLDGMACQVKNIMILAGCAYGVISFFVSRVEFNAHAKDYIEFKTETGKTVNDSFTLLCGIARVIPDIEKSVVNESCKQR